MPDILQRVWEVVADHPALSLGAVLIALVYVRVMSGPRSP
jgi:hypothetical protein